MLMSYRITREMVEILHCIVDILPAWWQNCHRCGELTEELLRIYISCVKFTDDGRELNMCP
jgi:hypothetical protein